MKKQTKKLTLNKKTISNLNSSEMSLLIGGKTGHSMCSHCNLCHGGGGDSKNCTQNQNTCPGHKTCYTC